MNNMFQLLIKRMFTLRVMLMEVAKPMITVFFYMSFTMMENLSADIVFMKNCIRKINQAIGLKLCCCV